MAVANYYKWKAAGEPVERPQWLIELKQLAEEASVGFLGDLGNEEHLTTDRPLDHTPFSVDEFPVQVSAWRIHAIDLAYGQWCYVALEDAKAGRLPWMKYIIFNGFSYSRRSGWVPKVAEDMHCHISGMTDYPVKLGLQGWNPFGTKKEEKVRIARTHSNPDCYIGNRVHRRLIKTQAELDKHLSGLGLSEPERLDNLDEIGVVLDTISVDLDPAEVAKELYRLFKES